ncbi:MAG: mechanosensitive ion channel domain-containing protein [Halioglobus sp.]
MLSELAEVHPNLPLITGIAALLLAALFSDLFVKRYLNVLSARLLKSNKVSWDDVLVDFNVLGRLAQLIPAIVIYLGIGLVPNLPDTFDAPIRNGLWVYMTFMVVFTLSALLSAGNKLYELQPNSNQRPIKGFVQLLQIIIFMVGAIFIVSIVLDKSLTILLSGLGAMTAVTMLVFKDTIVSLVASIQLTTQDMVRVGDWIEVPAFGADGDVIDVELHLVRVQNFDKTITTVPTHKLISDSFKNWRGMSEAGGRRIKRALHFDTSSVRFLTEQEIVSLRRFELLNDYFDDKERELSLANENKPNSEEAKVNLRRLTNIGTMRAYIYSYLKHSPHLDKDMTLLVRHLSPGPEGLPIEIYCFANTTEWGAYEGIQADIFDHILAIAPEFGLKIYQKPSGADVASALAMTE